MITTDTVLHDLANFLLLNASFSTDNSLQSGKLGVALYFFYARKNDHYSIHPEAGPSYLQEIMASPSGLDQISYAAGFSGGGVVLEHIAQAGLTAQHPNDIVQEIEPYLLDRLHASDAPQIDIANGLSGAGLYLLHRLNNPLVKKQRLQHVYIAHLQSCGKRIVRFFPFYRPHEYLYQAEASIWNGLSGTLIFLNRINELGLGDRDSEKVEKEITLKLLQHAEESPFNWNKAEAFTGMLNRSGGPSILQDRICASFRSFISAAHKELEHIDLRHGAFIAVLIKLLEKKCCYIPAGTLCEAISNKVKMALTEENIASLFDYDPAAATFQMGIHRGLCGTALSLLSLKTGNYNWLKIMGIQA